ncbi:MAG: hypothetical protein ACREA9_24190 [Pyrinomonadaceae bacterium]
MYYLNGGVGQLEALRKPLFVNQATYERARATLAPQRMGDLINPARRPVWFRTKTGLDVPYWNAPGFKDRDPMAPKSGLLYQPYWMTNKSRAKLIQRPNLYLKPKSEVLWHPATDEADGLGKGFNPLKAVKRAVTFTKTSFQPKKIFGAIGSVTGTMLTGGLGPIIAPKVFSANSQTMKTLGIATTGIAIAAGAVVLGPAIAASLGPTFKSAADMLGKGVDQLTGFMGAFNKLQPAQQQQQASQLTAQQIADVDAGRARFNPTTGELMYYQQQPPGSLMVQGQPVPPGYTGLEPGPAPGVLRPAEAGMMGGLSPMMLGVMIGIPLVVQLLLKERK